MRVLVTGAAGFVGSHICERLLELGHEVWGLDAFIPYYPEGLKTRNLEGLLTHPQFRLWRLDLRSDDLTDCLRGVDAVVNEAAMPGLPRSWTDLELYTSCNVVGLGRLLEACRGSDVRRFVHASTSSVYGAEAVGDEGMPTRPSSPYGITKLAAEHLITAYAELSTFGWVILRYFSIYGPRQRPDMAYNIFIDAMSHGRPITIFGDGLQTRSSTYVADCVSATVLALTRGSSGKTYNIGGGEAITLLDAVEIIGDALGVAPEVTFAESRAGDQRHTAADISLARTELTYEPIVVPRVGLPKQVEWQVASASATEGH